GGMNETTVTSGLRGGGQGGFGGRSGASRERESLQEQAKGEGKDVDRLAAPMAGFRRNGEFLKKADDLNQRMDLGRSRVGSVADPPTLGDSFQHRLAKPVSLARQKSALLPIVNKDVEGTRVSIYNERTQAKFPLLGLKFKNTSGLHLMQGPITVFEGSNYAG